MPELAEDDSPSAMNCVNDLLPSLNLLFSVDSRAARKAEKKIAKNTEIRVNFSTERSDFGDYPPAVGEMRVPSLMRNPPGVVRCL